MLNEELFNVVVRNTKCQNSLEDKIAYELYGCSYDELGYDEKEEVTYEALDRM